MEQGYQLKQWNVSEGVKWLCGHKVSVTLTLTWTAIIWVTKMWVTDSILPHSENIMGSCFDAGVGVQIKCLHYYPVFLSNERDILHIIMLCGNIKISESKKKKMVWPIIWLNSAIVKYLKLKCKIPFPFKDNTLPSGLCCKIFNGWVGQDQFEDICLRIEAPLWQTGD